MKISRQAKEATRQRILETARELFAQRGLEAATTRELAARAGIAAGTLFNYFPSKEALALALVGEALEAGHADFRARRRGDEGLEEALFLHVICGLRRLEPFRGFVRAVLETALSPFARGLGEAPPPEGSAPGDELRAAHLDVVDELIRAGAGGERPGTVTLYLYWTLYLGVLAFWAGDESPGQEDTLAVLDEALRVFALSLVGRPAEAPPEG